MNILRKAVTTVGGLFLAALLITAIAPKAARGVAAALVQVTNTSANPVPTVSADANFPYEAVICEGAEASCNPFSNFFSVPSTTTTGVPVKRLVIEDLNAICQGEGAVGIVELTVPPSADNSAMDFPLFYRLLPTAFDSISSVGHASVRMYADPSANVAIIGTNITCEVTVTGHLETK
jgi:hypothetical protein